MKKSTLARAAALLLAAVLPAAAPPASPAESPAVRSVNHRGYNSVAPENTLPAFELSREMGFTQVETDIRFTRDGVAVLLHDAFINRTARTRDGGALKSRIAVSDITWEELTEYDFGIWKDIRYKGTGIPTLESFLRLCLKTGMEPYLELKESASCTRERVLGVVDTVREYGLEDTVSWISFEYEYLEWVREGDPEARLGLLEAVWLGPGSVAASIEKAKRLQNGSNEVFLDVMYACVLLDGGCAGMCRDAGIPLEVYSLGTADDPQSLSSLDGYISGATTNIYRFEDLIPPGGDKNE